MALLYSTLGALRARLRTRLGFSGAGAAAGANQTMLNDFLQDAQDTLYWLVEWNRLRYYETVSIGQHQYLIDYPTNAHPERIQAISILRSNVWSPPLKKGIPPESYTTLDNYSWPQRWEPYQQIQLWPKADQAYSARIFYIAQLDRFEQDDDRATIDSDLIFTVALGDAKAHYRQPDAARYTEARDALLIKLKGKNWGKQVFSPYDYAEDPLVKPVVV